MRVTPSPSLHRCALRAGAVVAAGALLVGCSDDGSLDLGGAEESVDEAVEGVQETADDATADATDGAEDTEGEADAQDTQDSEDDESWWDSFLGWFSSDEDSGDESGDTAEDSAAEDSAAEDAADEDATDEESPDEATEEESPEDEATEEEPAEDDSGDDDSWWDTIVSWFSSDDEDDEGDEGDSEDEADEEEEAAAYGFPESCADAGAAESAGDLVPLGVTVQEDFGEFEQYADARYLVCAWDGPEEAFTLIYTENADPSGLVNLAGETGEQEMNWEVDVDIDVENYRSTEADELGGDLDYSSTTDGSTKIMHLSLPNNFWVAGVSVNQDVEQQDLERVVYDAAERLR